MQEPVYKKKCIVSEELRENHYNNEVFRKYSIKYKPEKNFRKNKNEKMKFILKEAQMVCFRRYSLVVERWRKGCGYTQFSRW